MKYLSYLTVDTRLSYGLKAVQCRKTKFNLFNWRPLQLAISTVIFMSITQASFAQQSPSGQEKFQLKSEAIKQIETLMLEKKSRTPVQKKISSDLLYELKLQRRDPLLRSVPMLKSTVEIADDGTTLVDIQATVMDELLSQIRALGGTVISSFPQYNAVRAKILLGQLEELAALPGVKSVRQAARPVLNKINTSEGDLAQRVREARAAFGVNGSGIKIGVISDSVDALAGLQSSGDLPAVTVLTGQSGVPGTSEGTAMLEIVHDLAPGAQLFFATAVGGLERFAINILDLRAAGCNVIVDDIGYPEEAAFQDGIVAQAVNVVTDNGALYFSSAGNAGNKNDGTSGVWEGDYAPTSSPINEYSDAQNFGNGQNFNVITKDARYYSLQWSDPWGSSTNDYDLFMVDATGSQVIAWSINPQDGTQYQNPYEVIREPSGGNPDETGALLIVVRFSGSPRFMRLEAGNGGELLISTAGQTYGHSAAQNAFSVAAVAWDACGGTPFCTTASVEKFSSDGPRKIFYKPDGTPITPGNFLSTGGSVRQKPDVAAADKVSTATSPQFNPFYGTSAAAPHAAAIAALVQSANRSLTPAQVRTILTSNTWDIEAPGVDRDSGAGIIDAYAAVQAAKGGSGDPAKTLINNYYQAILGRAPDPGGLAYWQGEMTRLQGLGVDVQEAFRVMAGWFFTSAEYLGRNTGDAQYVTDLYRTFFQRAPDAGGLGFWTGQLAAGMPRAVALYSFLFSAEFGSYMQGLLGNTASRGEVYAVVDFYRGFLNRLPDTAGFQYWLNRFRAAQCQGAAAVNAEVEAISEQFAASAEYADRKRSNRDYVGDLYYAFLRRGGELTGFDFWVNQLDAGARSREQLRREFLKSPEFQGRVQQIVNQGCLR